MTSASVKFFGTSTGKVTTSLGSPSAEARASISAKNVSDVSRRTGREQRLQKSAPARANSNFK